MPRFIALAFAFALSACADESVHAPADYKLCCAPVAPCGLCDEIYIHCPDGESHVTEGKGACGDYTSWVVDCRMHCQEP